MKGLLIAWIAICIMIPVIMHLQSNRVKRESLAACNDKGFMKVEAKRISFREFEIECTEPIPINKPPKTLP